MRRHSSVFSVLVKLALTVPVLAAMAFAAPAAHAEVKQINIVYNQAIRGGVVTDGVGMRSTSTTSTSGNLQIQIPVGAKVESAWLVSSVGALNPDVTIRPFIVPFPGTSRQVTLGSGAGSVTFPLEGAPPNRYNNDSGGPNYGSAYGSWVFDVTVQLRGLIPVGVAAPVNVQIQERGDGLQQYQPSIFGHSLSVVYSLPTAPLRNVVVAAGLLGGPDECNVNVSQVIPLARPTTLLCKESFPISISVVDNTEFCEKSGNLCSFSANGTVLSTNVGGLDDDISSASGELNGIGASERLGMLSTGSFGATGSAASPIPLGKTYSDGVTFLDSITAKPPVGQRKDDELYDLSSVIAEGATSVTIKYESVACDILPMIAFQTDADCGPSCAVDGDCAATQLCHDAKTPKVCIEKVANGSLLPAGGAINATCTAAQGARACISGACETSDNKCGLNIGSTCANTAQCRTGACGVASKKCELPSNDAGAPDSGPVDAGPVDSGRDTGVDAGSPAIDASAPENGAVPNGTIEGGGINCSTAPTGSATVVPMLLAAALALASLRRRK